MTREAPSGSPDAGSSRRAWLLLAAASLLAACGRKGDLYLPEGQGGSAEPESSELPPQRPDGSEDLELP